MGESMQGASGDTDTWDKLSVRPVLCSGKLCAFPTLICFLPTQTTEKQKGGEGIVVPRLCWEQFGLIKSCFHLLLIFLSLQRPGMICLFVCLSE